MAFARSVRRNPIFIFSPGQAEGDPQQLLKALRGISEIGATCFVPGHGPGTIEDLHLMIDYTERCLETAQALGTEGSNAEQRAKELSVPKRYKNWVLPQFYQTNMLSIYRRPGKASGK